jgi:hypothetical protein
MPGIIKEEPSPLHSESKSSLPYPSFSKEHSKESVGARPNINVYTPPATDLTSKDKDKPPHGAPNAPPSPPLTDQNSAKWRSSAGKPVTVETIPEEDKKSERDSKIRIRLQTKDTRSNGHLRTSSEVGSESPTKPARASTPLKSKSPNTAVPQRSVSQPTRIKTPATDRILNEDAANSSSDETSIAPEQPSIQRPGSRIPQAFNFPQRPAETPMIEVGSRGPTPLEVFVEQESPRTSMSEGGPPPPPPPPAPVVSIPRVDYLLQHGGLVQAIPKNLLLAGKPMAIQQATIPSQPSVIIGNLFEPYQRLLDDFDKVMNKNGSLAVATGYRSVARRLLERLEAVFARDISNEFCQCSMCEYENQHGEDMRGVSWGEILEMVSGRKDLPSWPPFSFVASPAGLGIQLEMHAPMQKLDIDVPEEYREHYIRQSRKTKQTVDKWLNRQTNDPASPPEEVDDETLTFAILTHISPEQRPIFKDLLCIIDKPLEPPRRAPSPEKGVPPAPTPVPQPKPRPDYLVQAGIAIQRLYRLATTPRDPETAIYLLNNPTLHNSLATLAAVSNDEWDILISGRFDGFLRSGADDVEPQGRQTPFVKPPSRAASQPHTNGYHSRQNSYSRVNTPAAPAAYGAPIAFDEETEIATLIEIEKDIYTGMEALEDAFEVLHLKAETVRKALRDRSAGLAAAQTRRRGMQANIEVRMGTPASNLGFDGRWDETDDDWFDGGVSELAPDDSASNISTSRRRRVRRGRRATPGLIEEDEEGEGSEGTASPKKG